MIGDTGGSKDKIKSFKLFTSYGLLIVLITAICSLAFMLPQIALAGTDEWTSTGPTNTDVNAVPLSPFYDNDSMVFAGTISGVYRSTDRGHNWELINNGLTNTSVSAVVMSPNFTTDRTLFAGTAGGIFRSTNNGDLWTAVNDIITDTNITAVEISPNYASDHTIFIGTNGGDIYRSQNGGDNWVLVKSCPTYKVTDLGISPGYASDLTIFVSVYGVGVYKSTDGGTTWGLVNNGLTNTNVQSLAVSPTLGTDNMLYVGTYNGGVFRSTDRGNTWAQKNDGLLNLKIKTIAITPNYPSNDSVILAGTDGDGIYSSRDHGESWKQVNQGLMHRYVLAIEPSPCFCIDKTVLAGTKDGGVYTCTFSDTSLPTTTLSTNPLNPDGTYDWFKTIPTITLTRNEAGTTYYQWDSTSTVGWTTYSSSFTAPEGQHTLYYYSEDTVGNKEVTKSMRFKVDSTLPTNPTITSSSHTANTSSKDNTVDIAISGAIDSISGLDGYSIEWSQSSTTVPDTTKDLESSASSLISPVLTDGSWYFHLITKDNAGNWSDAVHIGPFVIDADDPTTTLSTSPSTADGSYGWFKTIPTITLTRNEVGTTYYQWDSTSTVGWTTYSSSFTASQGHHTLYYYSKDSAGNNEVTKSQDFKVDSGLPTNPTVTSPSHTVAVLSSDDTIDIAISGAIDSISGLDGYSIEWSQSSTTVPDTTKDLESSASSLISPVLTDGSWYFHLITKDNAGNWSDAVHIGPFDIDANIPITTLSTSPSIADGSYGWFINIPTITLTRNETVGATCYQWDSTSPTGWTQFTTISGNPVAQQGHHTLYYYSEDSAGNNEVIKSQDFKVDSGLPTNPTVTSPSHTVAVLSSDDTIDIAISGAIDSISGLDGYSIEWSQSSTTVPDTTKDLESSASSLISPVLTDGSWYFHLITKDNAGNWSNVVHIGPFNIDANPPVTTLSTNPLNPDGTYDWFKTIPTITLTRNEAGTTYYQWDSTSTVGWTTYSSSFTASQGQHTLYYYSEDSYGNKETINSIQFKVDSTLATNPTVTSSSHTANASSKDNTVDIAISGAIDSISGLDGYSIEWSQSSTTVPDTTKDLESSASSLISPVLTDGSWYFHLITKDNAGNWSDAVHIGPFDIDANPPVTTLDPSATDSWFTSIPTITLTRNEVGSTYYQWDTTAGTWNTYTSGLTASEGKHRIYYYSVDPTGNIENVKSALYKVDTVGPASFNLVSPANGSTVNNDTPQTFTWTASSDSGSGLSKYQIYIDGSLNEDNISASSTSHALSSSLSPGNHTWYVVAIDTAGNSTSSTTFNLTIKDVVAPTTTVSPSDSSIWYSTVNITLTRDEAGTTYYQWDSTAGTWTTYMGSFTASEGQHRLYFYSVDSVGNIETVKYQDFKVDLTLPASFNLVSPAHGSTVNNDTPQTFTWTASSDADSGLAKYQIYIDGSLYEDNISASSTSHTLSSSLSSGNHTWYVKAVDAAGNGKNSTSTFNLTIKDVVAPTTTVATIPSTNDGTNGWFKTTPTITLTRDEAGTTYYQWDSTAGTWTTYLSSFTASEGQHRLYFYSVDSAGNIETVKYQDFKVDLTLPEAFNLASPTNGSTVNNDTPQTFTWTASSDSNLSKYQIYVDGSLKADHISASVISYTLSSSLSSGNHTWYVKAVDAAGNGKNSTSTFNLTIKDVMPPTTTLATNPSAADGTYGWFKTTPTITLTRDEAGTTYYQWDSTAGTWTTYISGFTAPEGQHRLYFYSVDSAGNIESVRYNDFRVDALSPGAFDLVSPVNNLTVDNDTPQTFTWTASSDSNLSKYQIYVDGSLKADHISASVISYTLSSSLSSGNHTWYVVAVDTAGNGKNSTSTFNLNIVDVIAPTTAITPSNTTSWFSAIPSITLTPNEPSTTYYQWDSTAGTWTTYSASFTASEGQHTLYYYSTDTANNIEAIKNKTFKVDLIPPASFNLVSPANNTTVNNDAPQKFEWTASSDSDSGLSKYKLYVDDSLVVGNISASAISYTLSSSLSPGNHTWYVVAVDAAGNSTQPTSILNLTINDVVPPKTTLTTNPVNYDGDNGWFKTGPSIYLNRDEPGVTYYQWDSISVEGWTSYTASTGNLIALDGNHRLYYYSKDSDGNAESIKYVDLKVDITVPSSSITAPVNAERISGATYTITGTSTDTASGVAKVEISINNGDWVTASGTTAWSYVWTLPDDGSYTIKTKVTDNAGNISSSGTVISVVVDNTEPVVATVDPAEASTNTAVSASISATFSEQIDPATINSSTFVLKDDSGNEVPSTVSYDSSTKTATLQPSNNLAYSSIYTVTITTGVKDTAGSSLPADKVWTFETVSATTAPYTTLQTTPTSPDGADGWFKTIPSITLSSNKSGTTYYQWDSIEGSWTVYGSPFSALEEEWTLYYYSQDTDGNVEVAKSKDFKVDAHTPSQPSNVKATALCKCEIMVTWDASTDNIGVTGYNIYNFDTDQLIGSTTETTFTVTGLTADTAYSFYVVSKDAAGNISSSSAVVQATTYKDEQPTDDGNKDCDLGNGVKIKYTDLLSSGYTYAKVLTDPPYGASQPELRFRGYHIDICTTASFSGEVEITIPYDESLIKGQEKNLKLMHWNGQNWEDITVSVDTVNNTITGRSTSLSPVGVSDSEVTEGGGGGGSASSIGYGMNTNLLLALSLILVMMGAGLVFRKGSAV